VAVPSDIKREIEKELGVEAEAAPRTQSEVLHEKTKLEESQRDQQVEKLKEKVNALQMRHPYYDLRVKDGKYTVTNYYDDPPESHEKDAEDGKPRRAKQKIETVRTASPLYKLGDLFRRCIRNKGKVGKYKVETNIMEGVNLAFEPRKMYLVL